MITRNQALYNMTRHEVVPGPPVRLYDRPGRLRRALPSAPKNTRYFDAVRTEYKARRDTLVEGLRKIPGVIYSEPKGAFYVMAKLPVDDAEP